MNIISIMEHDCINIKITSILSLVWTMDWMTNNRKRKLIEYGIAQLKMALD